MRVLIVEDEPIIALEIETIVHERLPDAETILASSVKEAFGAIGDSLGLAFLDIDVTDGKTYSLALELKLRKIPFVFVSAAKRGEAPEELADSGFIPKPFSQADIDTKMREFVANRKRDCGNDPSG